MVSELEKETTEDLKKFAKIQTKLEQAIRIRKNLIVRKLKLLEEYGKYPQTFKTEKFRDLLKRYEALHKKETNAVKIFQKGVDNALRIIKKLKYHCGWLGRYRKKVDWETKSDIKFTLSAIRKIDFRLFEYRTRMISEEKLFEDLEGDLDKQVYLMPGITRTFQKEIADDIDFITKLKQDNEDLKKIKDKMEGKLINLQAARFGGIVGGTGFSLFNLLAAIASGGIGMHQIDERAMPYMMAAGTAVMVYFIINLLLSSKIEEEKIQAISEFIKSDKIRRMKLA